MKAKEWYRKFQDCHDDDQFEPILADCLKSLVNEADELIKTRHCKTQEAKASAITEVNQKWLAIINIHNKQKNSHDYLYKVEFVDDGFKAAYVAIHPDNEWYFDLNAHSKKMDERREKIKKEQEDAYAYFAPHIVMPFEELTMQNIYGEILACTMALGGYARVGFTYDMIKPLAQRVMLLRYWANKGEINLQDVDEFEKDPDQWIANHVHLY